MPYKISLVVLLLSAVAACYAGSQLPQPYGHSLAYALGLAAGLAFLVERGRQAARQDKQLEKWEAQDVKLLTEVKSDKEKQLEAKIATLEAALQKALKKT